MTSRRTSISLNIPREEVFEAVKEYLEKRNILPKGKNFLFSHSTDGAVELTWREEEVVDDLNKVETLTKT